MNGGYCSGLDVVKLDFRVDTGLEGEKIDSWCAVDYA